MEKFLQTLRETHPDFIIIFTSGGCYRLFLILNEAFGECVPYYDPILCHVYTMYKGGYFDITGRLDDKQIINRIEPLFGYTGIDYATWHLTELWTNQK